MKLTKTLAALVAAITALVPSLAHAAVGPGAINTGDTAWMMVASALVLLMTPGLAFFYGGMVKSKNVVGTLAQNMVALAVVGIVWIVIGFSLAFVGDMHNGFIGSTDAMMLANVGQEAASGMTIPFIVFAAFQMMFAVLAAALMTGAFAERVSFKAWVLILILWSIIVYSPIAHWVWGGGWAAKKGALDFAGGFVVQMSAGFSALMAAILIGKRGDAGSKPYDAGMVMLGTSLLWFGWFGLSAGSDLTSGGLAAQAFLTTFAAAAVAMLVWMLVDKMKDGKPTLAGGCSAIITGLVAITPCAGYVTVQSAMWIGLIAAIICNLAARFVKGKMRVDDAAGVFARHGVGGFVGVVCLGLFGDTAVNSAGAMGLFNGSSALIKAQLITAGAVIVYAMVATFIIIKVVGLFTPVRVSTSDENKGLDATQHGEAIQNH